MMLVTGFFSYIKVILISFIGNVYISLKKYYSAYRSCKGPSTRSDLHDQTLQQACRNHLKCMQAIYALCSFVSLTY